MSKFWLRGDIGGLNPRGVGGGGGWSLDLVANKRKEWDVVAAGWESGFLVIQSAVFGIVETANGNIADNKI